MNDESLPIGWTTTTFAEVVMSFSNGIGGTQNKEGIGIPVSRIETIAEQRINFERVGYLAEHDPAKIGKYKLNHGDILFSHINSPTHLGKTAIFEDDRDLYHGINLLRIVVNRDVIHPRFFDYRCKLARAQGEFSLRAQHAVNQSSINQKKLGEFKISLPPLAEQKRIADKLDTVLARVDACRERLNRVPLILKRFRQSVLAAATSGQLTADWRGDIKKNWAVERAADVCEKVQSGGTPKEGFTDEPGVPFLKVYNIVNQKVSFTYRPQYVAKAVHDGLLAKSKVQPGDVLMNIVGPPLGKVAVVPPDFNEWNINQAITLFRPSARIRCEWLYAILCGGENIAQILNETKGSVGQVNISLSQCRNFLFPVPPIEEQTEIIRRIQTLFAFADRLEARLENACVTIARLTPTLLAKAFRGELVPQDPNDEPATELLKQLASARESTTKTKRSSKSVTPA
jgi:type I restriction enzyme S subunit